MNKRGKIDLNSKIWHYLLNDSFSKVLVFSFFSLMNNRNISNFRSFWGFLAEYYRWPVRTLLEKLFLLFSEVAVMWSSKFNVRQLWQIIKWYTSGQSWRSYSSNSWGSRKNYQWQNCCLHAWTVCQETSSGTIYSVYPVSTRSWVCWWRKGIDD